jgi:hypothetical protein
MIDIDLLYLLRGGALLGFYFLFCNIEYFY